MTVTKLTGLTHLVGKLAAEMDKLQVQASLLSRQDYEASEIYGKIQLMSQMADWIEEIQASLEGGNHD